MKKTILIFLLFFSGFLSAQTETSLLEGEWKPNPNETSYNCIITVDDNYKINKVKTIHSISYEKNKVFMEDIKFQDKYKVVTTHTNKENGHTVESTYVLIDPNTLSRQFKGDSNMYILYTRVNKQLN
tara:strand:- start:52 stop:432 length:381 start_codon:yes stop_codon:yes gene_type:complete